MVAVLTSLFHDHGPELPRRHVREVLKLLVERAGVGTESNATSLNVTGGVAFQQTEDKNRGLSVRCLKD